METNQSKAKYEELMRAYCTNREVSLRNELLGHYMYIAQIAAKKFSGRGIEFDDLLQTASLALIKAMERFDCNRDVQFSTFATPCVIGEIKNYFRDKSRTVRLPRRNGEMLKRMESACEQLTAELETQPRPDQIAARMGVNTEVVHELLEMRSRTQMISLDELMPDLDGEKSYADIVGDNEPAYIDIENKDFFERIMGELEESEQLLLKMRYIENRSQREVASRMGVSQMYISRMERRIITKIRQFIS